MAGNGASLLGDKKLERKLNRIAKPATLNRIQRQPMSNALTPISKTAKANAPKRTRTLSKSIGKKVKAYRGNVWGGVGVRSDPKYWRTDENGKVHKPGKYGPKVEFGTVHSAADGFLRRALDSRKGQSLRVFESGVRVRLAKEALKA